MAVVQSIDLLISLTGKFLIVADIIQLLPNLSIVTLQLQRWHTIFYLRNTKSLNILHYLDSTIFLFDLKSYTLLNQIAKTKGASIFAVDVQVSFN